MFRRIILIAANSMATAMHQQEVMRETFLHFTNFPFTESRVVHYLAGKREKRQSGELPPFLGT